jgi:hypothetical protein
VTTNGGTGDVDLTVAWSSSNNTIASVSSAGVITGNQAGNTTIIATSNEDATFKGVISVTVEAPPTAANALLTYTVTPNNVAIVANGGTAAIATQTTTSAGANAPTFAHSSNSARCTVNSSGANPTITTVGQGAGSCVITSTATATGTGLVTNSIAQAVAVTITAAPPALISLTVAPTTVNLAPGGAQQITTTAVLSSGAAVTYASTSSNNAVATVTAAGANPTITAQGNGTAQITITASGSGGVNAPNQISAIVDVNVAAASVSISSVTFGAGVPVNVAAVLGQIEVTMNISSGNQQIGSVAVELGPSGPGGSCVVGAVYTEAERQNFGVNGAPTAPVTLSINTAEFNANFVPLWLNGLNCLRARIFPTSGPVPDASNTYQFTLVNPDVVYFNNTVGTTGGAVGLNHTGNSAAQANNAANIWWRSGFTFRAHPVLYSGVANVVSITYQSSACNGGGVNSVGPNFSATFSCAGVQSTQNINNFVNITYVAGYTLTVSPVGFMTAASPGFVPGNPVYAAVTTREDNVGPVTATPVFSNAGSGGWHGNGSNGVNLPPVIPGTTYSVSATDGGVGGGVAGLGLATQPQINEVNGCAVPNCAAPVGPTNNITAANNLTESLTPLPYQLRGTAVNDILGNPGTVPVGNITAAFGVDLVVLDARYADGLYGPTVPAAVANPAIFPGPSTGQIYTTVAPAVAPALVWPDAPTDLLFVDAIDTRSGLNNAGALFQTVRRFWAGGTVNTYTNVVGGDPLNMIQANSWVQNPLGAATSAAMDGTFGPGIAGPGYYWWNGHVADRANNRRLPRRGVGGGVQLDSISVAIDAAVPNITGIGFQTALYAGAQPATWTFSANDDLELRDGQVTLNYWGAAGPCGAPCASGSGVAFLGPAGGVTYPYGTAAYTSPPFGVPFDGTIVNVLNNSSLTLGYYIVRFDIGTAAAFVPGIAPSGNVAGFTSGEIQSNVVANIRDVAFQSALAPLAAPILNTQITDRVGGAGGAPGYTAMIDWRILAKGATIVVRDAAPTSLATPFCDRVDIYEAVNPAGGGGAAPVAGMLANDPALGADAGDGLRWRGTMAGAPAPTDNGFQRFFTYTSALPALPPGVPAATGLFTAACVKSGSALLSPLF